jgi:hypothetical protein
MLVLGAWLFPLQATGVDGDPRAQRPLAPPLASTSLTFASSTSASALADVAASFGINTTTPINASQWRRTPHRHC